MTRSFRQWLVEQARLHAASGGKRGGLATHFAETGQQERARVVQLFTPQDRDAFSRLATYE